MLYSRVVWILLTIYLLCLFGDCAKLKYNIGVVGKSWYDTFKKKLVERKEEDIVTLTEIEINSKAIFYENMMENFQQINSKAVHVLVGITSLSMAQAAAHLRIPYFATDTNVHPSRLLEYSKMPNFYLLPITDELYSKAIIDLISHFRVTKVVIVIDSIVNYQHFVRPLFEQKNINILMFTLTYNDTADGGKLRAKIDQILEDSRDSDCWDFVVMAELNVVKQMISRAKYYGMLVRPNKWYLPSFVCVDINIPAIIQIYSNITMINEQCSESYLSQNMNYTTEAMVNVVIQLFRMVEWKLNVEVFRQRLKTGKWRFFDDWGVREQSQLTLHTLNTEDEQTGHLRLVGAWTYNMGNSYLSYNYSCGQSRMVTPQIHLRVAAVEEHPHLIRQLNGSVAGFGVDMVSELSTLMNATFTITVYSQMGIKSESGWTGVIAELLNNRADITLGPLVQSIEIEQDIDFSTSFKQREISLVMTAPSPSVSLFQFVQPFSWDVWLCCFVSTVIATFLTWGIERIHDKFFDNKLPVKLNFKESSWFALGNVLKKQLDVFPNSVPALINNASIFFFSLIIVTMYTANLAAFLTVQSYPNVIKEVEDLIRLPPNSKIYFGTVKDSSILEFFRESDLELFKKMYHHMAVKNPHWLVNSTAEGYRRALNDSYVFIWDDSVNQYEIFMEPEYDCKLIIVGRPFGKRSFAIGMQQNSLFKELVNRNLLHLLESGKIESLLEKWWKSGSICAEIDSPNINILPLSLSNVAGVFLIVVVGIFVATVWFLVQVLIYHVKERRLRHNCRDLNTSNPENQEVLIAPQANGTNGGVRHT